MEEEKHTPDTLKGTSKESGKEIHSHQEGNLTKKMRENPWILSTFVLGVLALVLLVGNFGGVTGGVVDEGVAKDAVLSFVKAQGAEAEVVDVEEEGNFYVVTILFQGQEIPLYVTKDGEFLVQGLTPLNEVQQQDSQQQESVDVPKSDKPVVELFIMSHCPYGTQAEKGIIPAIKALGDTIDAKIRFVHYFMHEPEETETPREVCIREEQPSKWYAYLGCFLEDGDSDRCLTEAKIDKNKMEKCISSGKADGYYKEDSDLSNSYGVRRSPSLVINGAQASSGRDSASYLKTICSAFNEAPEECNAELSSASPSPMWGYEEGQDTGAQC